MAVFVIIALVVMAFMQWKHPKLMRVEWNKIASFLAFMALLTVARISCYDFLVEQDPNLLWELQNNPLRTFSAWKFILVFWEDVFFGMSIYWLMTRFRKSLAIPMAALISVVFGQLHGYQGVGAIIITTFYPYFISYRLGKKHGFGTVQIGHILYDFITYFTILFMPYLV